MGRLGIQEIMIILLLAIAIIAAYVYAINRIIKSNFTSYQKIVWIIAIIIFHFIGLVVFFIYYGISSSPKLKSNL
jgi:hypothetical protein